jgi:leader peptidase (prepilin peptidase)/N-methyltransferase
MPATENIEIPAFFVLFAFALGCIVGSFLNVVVWRLPRGESLSRPPSHCPSCGHFIRSWENIPILSWLFLRRRCSSCRQAISWRYPAGEAANGLLFAGIFWHLTQANLPLALLPGYFWLAGAVLAAALIDAQHRIVPNQITYSGMVAAMALAILLPASRMALHDEAGLTSNSLIFQTVTEKLANVEILAACLQKTRIAATLDCLLGIIFGGGILALFAWIGKVLLRAYHPEVQAVGGGDVKFLAMIAAFLGADAAVYILLGGAALGFLTGIMLIALKKSNAKLLSSLPFAPFLAIPTLAWLICGNWFYILWKKF